MTIHIENGGKRTKERSKSTVVREMVRLRAALGHTRQPFPRSTDAAWQHALETRLRLPTSVKNST